MNTPLPPEFGTTGAAETPPSPGHRKAIIASSVALSLAGGSVGGLFGILIGKDSQRNADQARLERADREKACLSIVLKNTKPGQSTAVVHLASLTPAQRRDCALNGLAGDLKTGAGSFAPRLGAEVMGDTVDVEVRLPDEERLRLDIGAQEMRAEVPDGAPYKDIAEGALIGLIGTAGALTVAKYPKQTAHRFKAVAGYMPTNFIPLDPKE